MFSLTQMLMRSAPPEIMDTIHTNLFVHLDNTMDTYVIPILTRKRKKTDDDNDNGPEDNRLYYFIFTPLVKTSGVKMFH